MKKIYALSAGVLLLLFSFRSFSQTVHVITATNFLFTPKNLTAAVGDTIRFTFGTLSPTGGAPAGGGFRHTTTSTSIPAGAAAWNDTLFSDVPAHYAFSYVITAPGQYNYICVPHATTQNMVGSFTVSSVAPVKLVSFTAASVNGKPQLNWETATEENTDRFSVEMSYDGLNFSEVGTAKAVGNSTSLQRYSFQVSTVNPAKAYLYFRLVSIDRDLKKQFSDIVLLHNGNVVETEFIKSFFPNPAQNGDHLYFTFDSESKGTVMVNIFETGGRKIYALPLTAVEGVNQSHLPLPRMRKGAYYVQFSMQNKQQTLPLFVR